MSRRRTLALRTVVFVLLDRFDQTVTTEGVEDLLIGAQTERAQQRCKRKLSRTVNLDVDNIV